MSGTLAISGHLLLIDKFEIDKGVAIDREMKLMWLRFAHGQVWQNETATGTVHEVTWQKAFAVADEFNEQGGYSWHKDWRLPTLDELRTLIDRDNAKDGNYIHAVVFPNNAGSFWTATPYPYTENYAWVLDFNYGYDYNDTRTNHYAVRLVRDL
jgi:hypothetical protein